MEAPDAVFVGCVVNATWLAAAAVMLNAVEVSDTNEPSDASSLYPFADVLIERSLKVAAPPTAVRVNVPFNVALPGLAANAMVMSDVSELTRFPKESCT